MNFLCQKSSESFQISQEQTFLFIPPVHGTVVYHLCTVWQYGLWGFQERGTKSQRFLHMNQGNLAELPFVRQPIRQPFTQPHQTPCQIALQTVSSDSLIRHLC